ncbi:tyrosine-type recombinase/integrase [Sporolactobacillus terrae]|uniref:tyrosine-type recombinase/integrase n=1 Tax=Sporolactobacillus terrae TaxID=269673 RepID=UPI00048DC2DA|nr:site-specific integrase [Sporolactobacillus terrae]
MAIKKLDSGYQVRVSYKDGNKYRTKNVNGIKSIKHARLIEADLQLKFAHGYKAKADELLFSEFYDHWYKTYRKGKLSFENDRELARTGKFVAERFPGVKLKEVTRDLYQKMLNDFGETRATATVKKYHVYMRACLRFAIEEGILFKDPTYKAVARGKIAEKKESLKYLNFDDSKRLIVEIRKDMRPKYVSRYMALFQLATGCRLEEVLGMTWSCFDEKKKIVKIARAWDYKDTHDFCRLKNKASYRTITIDTETIKIMKQLHAHQSAHCLATKLKNEKDLCFINDTMKLVSPNAVNKLLKKLCVRLKITEITSHGLRHTHASILLLHKHVSIKYLSRRLGHRDIVTTLKTYTHILDELDQIETRAVDATMSDLYGTK